MMMKHWKRVLAMLLAVVMAVGVMPIGALAQDEKTIKTIDGSQTDLSVQATNPLAKALSDAVEENDSGNGAYSISSLRFDGDAVVVGYAAEEDCRVLLGFYDESGKRMYTSVCVEVSKDDTSKQIDLPQEGLPENYMVKAFLIDSEDRPLCSS